MSHSIVVKVRMASGTYMARYKGKSASNTASAKWAVERLAGKVFGALQLVTVTRIDDGQDYQPGMFRITPEESQKCRVCGCSLSRACAGGCHWVEADLCSSCAPGEVQL